MNNGERATAYIGLGSNMGYREGYVRRALELLGETPGVSVVSVSPLHETEPVGYTEQAKFINAVAKVETTLTAHELLAACLGIESALGRVRTITWGPRTVDLDLLLYGEEVIDTPDLKVPHPLMSEREFVLTPLAEVAPDAWHPVLKKTAREMLEALAPLTPSPARGEVDRREHYMRIIDNVAEMKALASEMRGAGRSVGLVPTMGYLHEGHLSLVRESKSRDEATVLSIFVNPTQFGPAEDLARYPRDMEGDLAKCRAEGVDCVFAPDAATMYPEGYGTFVEVKAVSEVLCGTSRPGHFRGVATVVTKLFNIVGPDRAYFGRKDYQQTVVIKRMATDLDMDVEVVVMPTVREPDGLAMSSRNKYLGPDERKAAAALYSALSSAKALHDSGETKAAALLARARNVLEAAPAIQVEYLELVDPAGLRPVADARGGAVMAVAARLGTTRLIDNMEM